MSNDKDNIEKTRVSMEEIMETARSTGKLLITAGKVLLAAVSAYDDATGKKRTVDQRGGDQ